MRIIMAVGGACGWGIAAFILGSEANIVVIGIFIITGVLLAYGVFREMGWRQKDKDTVAAAEARRKKKTSEKEKRRKQREADEADKAAKAARAAYLAKLETDRRAAVESQRLRDHADAIRSTALAMGMNGDMQRIREYVDSPLGNVSNDAAKHISGIVWKVSQSVELQNSVKQTAEVTNGGGVTL